MSAEPELRARETRVLWIALALVLGGTAAGLGLWIRGSRPENLSWLWLQIVGIASVPGKYVIFSGLAPGFPMGPLGLALLCVPVDSVVALALALFLGPLLRVRWIGPRLHAMHLRAREVLSEYPRLQRMAFLGVALFVFLPLPGTGAVGGMFAGQIVGLSRPMSVLAIALGTAMIAALFLFCALTLGAESQRMLQSPVFAGACALGFAVFLWVAYRAVKRKLRQP